MGAEGCTTTDQVLSLCLGANSGLLNERLFTLIPNRLHRPRRRRIRTPANNRVGLDRTSHPLRMGLVCVSQNAIKQRAIAMRWSISSASMASGQDRLRRADTSAREGMAVPRARALNRPRLGGNRRWAMRRSRTNGTTRLRPAKRDPRPRSSINTSIRQATQLFETDVLFSASTLYSTEHSIRLVPASA